MTTPALRTRRLDLEPLSVEHAEEMSTVLADPALHAFTGGEPLSAAQLRATYARQVRGTSADGAEIWHNWVLRERSTGDAAGYVQATVLDDVAELAWVVGTPWQGRDYAAEAASAVCTALAAYGCRAVIAHIAPGHTASESVARRIGLEPTGVLQDGERRWEALAADVSTSRDPA